MHILNDVLDFSKIEAGKVALEQMPFDLRQCVTQAMTLMSEQARAKGLSLGHHIQESVPRLVEGDPHRVGQIVTNLIANAIKFTDQGRVDVSVSIEQVIDSSVMVKVEVKDTGPGIDPETQQRLFQSFSQADNSTTRKFGGTGLGLAISKQLVTMMQGTIGVTSQLGAGSCFWFTAKFRMASEEPRNDAEQGPSTAYETHGQHVARLAS
jgi:signal transduction histidine kinase